VVVSLKDARIVVVLASVGTGNRHFRHDLSISRWERRYQNIATMKAIK